MIRFFYIALCASLCFACNRQSKELSLFTEVFIDHKNVGRQTAELVDLVDSVFVIPLRSREDFLMGNITNIHITEDRIYILDDSKSKTLTVHDLDGNPLFRVGRSGRGPAEYLGIGGFLVTPEHIMLLDGQMDRMLVYDAYGVYQYYFESEADAVGLVNDTIFVEHDGAGGFAFRNMKGDVLRNASLDFRGIEAIDWNNFSYQGDNLNFLDIINQRVYRVTPDSLMPHRQVHLGRWQVSANYYDAFRGSAPTNMFANVYQQTLIFSNNDHGMLLRYRENSVWESYNFQVKFLPRMAYRHKASGRTLLLGAPSLGEDYEPAFQLLYVLGSVFTTHEDFFVTSVLPGRALEFAESENVENAMLLRLQKRILDMEISEDDNPLLLFFRLGEPE
ncbi:MAG: 6-bladed beta-propeller [Rikenellaceae bacterium]|nr:6-bladed beta-propeller [Rikenellaceae bacterium]MCL2691916.1 6-bladed beta-propeller [Rikenellaceae bacterium]